MVNEQIPVTTGVALADIILDNLAESNRVGVNTQLLDSVKATVLKHVNYKYMVSNSSLVAFALIQLLDDDTKSDIITHLSKNQRFKYYDELSHVYQSVNDTTSRATNRSSINVQELQRLSTQLQELKTLEHANLTLNAWLAQNRMGLFTDDLPNDTRDVYMLLRADNTTGIVDEALKAGASEESRQAQKQL